MDFYEAYTYLENHETVKYDGINYFYKCLDVAVVKVNPNTMAIDDNDELNTKTQVWLEFGKAFYDNETFNCVMTTHDIDFDCGDDTFEEVIIELAELVQRKYYNESLKQ